MDETAELERPRNPTPTAALTAVSDDLCDPTAGPEAASSGAIPKTGHKYDRRRERTRHVSAGTLTAVESVAKLSRKLPLLFKYVG